MLLCCACRFSSSTCRASPLFSFSGLSSEQVSENRYFTVDSGPLSARVGSDSSFSLIQSSSFRGSGLLSELLISLQSESKYFNLKNTE